MIQLLALGCILLAAGWLAFVALVCLVAPTRARAGLASMGSSAAIQFGEHIPRAITGMAFLARAAESKVPMVFSILGWFLLASSIMIMLAPRAWHHAYARWWAERIALPFYRVAALPTLFVAAAIVYAAM